MTVLMVANAAGAAFSWWAYAEAARYSAEARAASGRAALASSAAERVTAWSADTGTLAFAARQAKLSEELSGTYGNVLGSELAASSSLRRLGSLFPESAKPVSDQWDRLRLVSYVWVNAEATEGGTTLRISRMPDGKFRASVASNLTTPTGIPADSASLLRAETRKEVEALKDGTLRNIVVASEQASVRAVAEEDRARLLALNGTIAWVLASLALAVIASIWLYRGIARPLAAARSYANRVAGGEWSAAFPTHRSDEIGALTHAVENMKDAFVRKATIMSEMAGAVLVTSGQVDAAAKHAQEAVAASGIASDDLTQDLAAVSAKTEVLTGLAAQMLED